MPCSIREDEAILLVRDVYEKKSGRPASLEMSLGGLPPAGLGLIVQAQRGFHGHVRDELEDQFPECVERYDNSRLTPENFVQSTVGAVATLVWGALKPPSQPAALPAAPTAPQTGEAALETAESGSDEGDETQEKDK